MDLEMIKRNMKLKLATYLTVLFIFMYLSLSNTFLGLLLGLLLIPPILVFASMFFEGVPIMAEGLQNLVASGNELFVISITEESIILEPQHR